MQFNLRKTIAENVNRKTSFSIVRVGKLAKPATAKGRQPEQGRAGQGRQPNWQISLPATADAMDEQQKNWSKCCIYQNTHICISIYYLQQQRRVFLDDIS